MIDKAEYYQAVAISETKQDLIAFIESETADEPYKDGYFRKVFKKEGPLEWYNPPAPNGEIWINVPAIIHILSEVEYIEIARQEYRDYIDSLIKV